MKRWMVLALFALSFLLTIFITKEDVAVANTKVNTASTYSHTSLNIYPDTHFDKLYNFPDFLRK